MNTTNNFLEGNLPTEEFDYKGYKVALSPGFRSYHIWINDNLLEEGRVNIEQAKRYAKTYIDLMYEVTT